MFERKERLGLESLGVVSSASWCRDPKRLLFSMARYKFVSRMFAGFPSVLEVGCGDAWASRIVRQSVQTLTVTDYDAAFVDEARDRANPEWDMTYKVIDFSKKYAGPKYSGIYLLDVLEHISPSQERQFLTNILRAITPSGALLVGMPSVQSQALIPRKRRDPGHVNCKTGEQLKDTMTCFFSNVFMFSMNDELVHTGNSNMAFYIFALCCGPRLRRRS